MTAHNDLDRQLTDFLRDGPTELPYQSFNAVRDRTEQRGQRVVIGAWRLPEMNKIVTLGLAAVGVVAVLVGAQLLGSPIGRVGSPTSSMSQPSAAPERSPSLAGVLPEGPHVLVDGTEGGVPITVTIAAPVWDGSPNQGRLCWAGPDEKCARAPDTASFIAFQGREYEVYGDACDSSTTPETTATSVDELIDALGNQMPREASAPADITVGGYPGKKLFLRRTDDVALGYCNDRGLFDSRGLFEPTAEGAAFSQGPGGIEEVWAIDVDGTIVVLFGAYFENTAPEIVDELQAVMASATFEVPR